MDIKKILSRILDIALILLIIFLGYRILQQRGFIKTRLEGMEKLPKFKAETLDGRVLDSSILEGKDYTIINIWSPMCGACIEEIQAFKEIEDYIEESNGQIIGIGINSTKGMVRKSIEENNIEYINVMNNLKINRSFVSAAVLTPTTITVDSEGNILDLSVGSFGKDGDIRYFTNLIDDIKK